MKIIILYRDLLATLFVNYIVGELAPCVRVLSNIVGAILISVLFTFEVLLIIEPLLTWLDPYLGFNTTAGRRFELYF